MSLDYLIKGATIVDGTGSAPYVGNVGIKDGKIAALGEVTDEATDDGIGTLMSASCVFLL